MKRTLVVLAIASVLQAQPKAASGVHPFNAPDLEQFMDEFVPAQLKRLNAAGAAVSVVKDGTVLLCRGYGYADLEKRVSMTGSTLVRPASISKLFTAIAVLQLAREGKLDLDRDVNDYLDLRIPTPPGGTPATLRLLLRHRAGFEDHLKELFQAGGPPTPASVYTHRNLPLRLFVHGDVPAYSNYSYALAGYVVERASGQRFEEYAAQHVLQPLGMTRSTFAEPPPSPLDGAVARGYSVPGGPPLQFFEVMPPSVGGLSASAENLARFMIAVLKREPLVEADLLPLAFEQDYAAGNRFVGKHGLTNAVVSHLALLPEAGFGLFVSYNTAIPFNAQTELLEALAQRYFPHPERPLVPVSSAAVDSPKVAGAYQTSQREDSNFLRLALIGQLIVEPLPDHRIRLGTRLILTETAPLVFDGQNDARVSFRPTPGGGMSMTYNQVPIAMEWQRVPWWLDRRLVAPLAFFSVALMVLSLLFRAVADAIRRFRHHSVNNPPRGRRDFRLVRTVIVIDLLALAGFGITVSVVTRDLTRMRPSLDPWLVIIYALAWLGVLGSPLLLWIAWRFWRDGVGSLWTRIHHTALAASALVFGWFAVIWHIAGTTLNY
jgi:CubicO group peptidase (beta-lactamase class C family)